MELIDSLLQDRYKGVKPLPQATINTESPAWAIDRLSILELKIYHTRKETERTDVSDVYLARFRKKLEVLEEQRKDLSTAIDQLLTEIRQGRKLMKVYKQMKLYRP